MSDAFVSDYGVMRDVPEWASCVMNAAPRRKDFGYDMRFRISRVAARAEQLMQTRARRRFEKGLMP